MLIFTTNSEVPNVAVVLTVWSLGTSSSITWEPVKKCKYLGPNPDPNQTDSPGVVPDICVFTSLTGDSNTC